MVPCSVCLRRRVEARWERMYVEREEGTAAAAGGIATCSFRRAFWKRGRAVRSGGLWMASRRVQGLRLALRFWGEEGEEGEAERCFRLVVGISRLRGLRRRAEIFGENVD